MKTTEPLSLKNVRMALGQEKDLWNNTKIDIHLREKWQEWKNSKLLCFSYSMPFQKSWLYKY